MMVMRVYERGDFIKFELCNERTGESEWMWLRVDRADDQARVVFGRLDSEPLVNTELRLGQEVAVSYDLVREHTKWPALSQ